MDLAAQKVRIIPEGGQLRILAPTGILTPELMNRIKNFKQDLLHYFSESDAADIPCVDRHIRIPLSFSQERIWFLEQLDRYVGAYQVPLYFYYHGSLSVQRLQRALNKISKRHEILRTIFPSDNDGPYQKILPDPHYNIDMFEHIDIKEVMRLDVEQPFDIERGPLLRLKIVKIDDSKWALLFNMHHLITDEWSQNLFLQELFNLCEQHKLTIQYADYTIWQRNITGSLNHKKSLEFWRSYLQNVPILTWPIRSHGGAAVSHGKVKRFEISHDESLRLKKICQLTKTTSFVILLTAFYLLLRRFANQCDICIGTPVANRDNKSLEKVMGLFLNTIPIRISPEPEMTKYEEIIECVKNSVNIAFTHQAIPFEKIVEQVDITRDYSVNPVFQVLFTMDSSFSFNLDSNQKSDFTPIYPEKTNVQFDLAMDVSEHTRGISIVLEYNEATFTDAMVNDMSKTYRLLLRRLSRYPQHEIKEKDYLPDSIIKKLLLLGNGPIKSYNLTMSLLSYFSKSVQSNPNAVAVTKGNEKLTYQQLDMLSNQFANYLRQRGIKRQEFVALQLERSVNYLAALLGVMKNSAVFIPIDVQYPQSRIQHMLEDSDAKIVLTDGSIKAVMKCPVTPIQSANYQCGDQAYLMYTSGSTGKPKGALITQKSMLHHILAEIDALSLPIPFSFLQTAPISSDMSVWQFLGPLCVGGSVYIASDIWDTVGLWQSICDYKINLMELVPSVLSVLLDELEADTKVTTPTHLHMILVSGETVSTQLINRWLYLFPHIPITNAYGPTEASDDICQAVITTSIPQKNDLAPIGSAIPNTQLLLLNHDGLLSPPGVIGEIVVSGLGVGDGYWKSPNLTAEKFILHPYPQDDYSGICYRTGDLGRWRSDGLLECIGRQDQQQKINGFRVELGEIESVIKLHPEIDNCIVLCHDVEQQMKITAYYIANSDVKINKFLKKYLPNYMFPHYWIKLDAFPLSPSGKIDRNALPKPLLKPINGKRDIPVTIVEKELSAIWGEVLKIEISDLQVNFFDVGGHSLLAMKIINRICRQFTIKVSVVDLLVNPVLAELVTIVEYKIKKRIVETKIDIKDLDRDYFQKKIENLLRNKTGI